MSESNNARSSGEDDHTLVDEHDLDEPDWDHKRHGGYPDVDPSFVCEVAEALETGDEIIINDRSRPLEVLGFEEQRSSGVMKASDYPYHILWLRGNGTEYRLRWSHQCNHTPRLNSESELETRESYNYDTQQMENRTRATETGERVRWVCPVDIDESDLAQWALSRNLTVTEEVDDAE